MMQDPETFGEIKMGCALCFKMRDPSGKKGYWETEGKNGYKCPFYGFALIPKPDDSTGKQTALDFIAKLNNTEDDDLKDLIEQYISPPQFKLANMATVEMGKGKSFPGKMMAVDDIIHLWHAMNLDPTKLLEKDEITEPIGVNIINFFFNNSTAMTIKTVRNINDKIKQKEQTSIF